MADNTENFAANTKCKSDLIKILQDSPEDSYMLVATIPNGEHGSGRLAVYGPQATTFSLHGFYALIRLLLEGAQDDLLASALGLENAEET